MKPKGQTQHEVGLLEYLEEIIGSNKYVKGIEEASAELEVLNDEKAAKRQRVKLVEREKENLEGAKTEAVEYLSRQKEVINKRALHQQLVRHQHEQSFKDITAKKAEAQKKFDEHQKRRAEYSKESEEIASKYKKEKKEFDVRGDLRRTWIWIFDWICVCVWGQDLGTAMEEAKTAQSDAERKEIKIRAELKKFETLQEKIKKEISAAAKSISELQSTLKTNREDIAKGEAELEKLNKGLEKEQAGLEELYTANRGPPKRQTKRVI